VAGFSHSVVIPRPPADVFPWLLEEDKVPRWTGSLESYELVGPGPIGQGSRLRQVLDIGGRRIDVQLEVARYDPPRTAESRFSSNGIDVVTAYSLSGEDGATRLTQTLEAKPTSLSARLLLPVLQPRLERKLTDDLERLRELLAAG
jgi:uncharacterized protein YndB with AHSA1/START domain